MRSIALPLVLLQLLVASLACDSHGHSDEHRHLQGEQAVIEEEMFPCGTASPSDEHKRLLGEAHVDWAAANHHRDLAASSYDVPVYWHILQHNATYGTLQRTTIVDGFMPTINDAFSETPFRFVLQGIDVRINPQNFNCSDMATAQQALRRGGTNALNIYVCNLHVQGFSGYAYLPAIVKIAPLLYDGIVMMNADLAKDGKSLYWTLSHEIGHFLGLFHTFEGGCSSNTQSSYNGYYVLSGDGVTDTAAQSGPTWNNPGQSSCWRMNPPINSCPDGITGVDSGNDNVNNFMDYTTAGCRALYGTFSPMQIQRMVANWETFRKLDQAITYVAPTIAPTKRPIAPTRAPTRKPTFRPITKAPTRKPTFRPTTKAPTRKPTARPTRLPTMAPSKAPTRKPTAQPVRPPTKTPTLKPVSKQPTKSPTKSPTINPIPVAVLSTSAPTSYNTVVQKLARRCARRVWRVCGACPSLSCTETAMTRCEQPDAGYLQQFRTKVGRMLRRFCRRAKK